MSDVRTLGAAALGRAIGEGRACPVELAETFLDAIDAHPEGRRIYTRSTRTRARAEAMAARARARLGLRRGTLDGVPISWKDLFDSAGVPTEGGSRLLAGHTPTRDAALLDTATLAGLVCLGKTQLSELAFSGLGLNPTVGTPPNVNFPGAVPGGSSSGAAASVAFGLAAAAVGSDTGGSIRVPAAWNDLVGFKPTRGLLPLDGSLPLAAAFDTAGPLARTVEDATLLFAALSGRRAPGLSGATLAGTRLMVLDNVVLEDLCEANARAHEAALARLEAAGARLERRSVPAADGLAALAPVLYAGEAYGHWRDTIEARPDAMFPRILERFRGGAAFSAADYVTARDTLQRLRRDWAEATAGVDAVLAPTTPNQPPDAARLIEDPAYYTTQNLLSLRNTRLGNMLDVCAITLPTGVASAGLMLMAPRGADGRLLRLAAAAESALAD